MKALGFVDDPFESTNAETEVRLGEYFVAPPYFASVMGDPENPQSHIIFAPRGGGKTAQRRMIEAEASDSGKFLCITYDRFELKSSASLSTVTIHYHLANVCRLMVAGLLVTLDAYPDLVGLLTEHQKNLLKVQIQRFLGSLSAQEFETATATLKNLGDRVREFWEKYGGPVGLMLNALAKKLGLGELTLPVDADEPGPQDESLAYHLAQLARMAQTIGYSSTYVLVDRLDEGPFTSDPASAFALIAPLMLDLPVLETPGIGFKFFMWDQAEGLYKERGGRPDRVTTFRLEWHVKELEEMLRHRISAYSDGRLGSLNELLCDEKPRIDLHQLVGQLAAGSPRDMIRLAQRVTAEETRTAQDSRCIHLASTWRGVDLFARERATELVGDKVKSELAKVARPAFTINELANDIFRIKHQSARSKVQGWMNTGFVARIGDFPNPGGRPLHLYGVSDVRLAIAISPTLGAEAVLAQNARLCPACRALCISDRVAIVCQRCSKQFEADDAESLLEACMQRGWREYLARQRERQRRRRRGHDFYRDRY